MEVAHPHGGSSSTWPLVELEFGSVGFWREGKTGLPGEKPFRTKERITTTNLTHIWRRRLDLNPGHIILFVFFFCILINFILFLFVVVVMYYNFFYVLTLMNTLEKYKKKKRKLIIIIYIAHTHTYTQLHTSTDK